MPVAVIAVSMLVMLMATTPSEALRSCMSKTEARQHFGSIHIYWHGQGRCWDAKPTRRDHRIRKVQRTIEQPKWHGSMAEMLSDDEPVQTTVQVPWVDRWAGIASSQFPLDARWVDAVQIAPPPVIEREPEPIVSASAMVLVVIFIVQALTLATIEVLFRSTVYEWSKSTTSF
jgi:hypothetical protein